MSTASLENCKRLYELSGWEDTEKWFIYEEIDLPEGKLPIYTIGFTGPAYDAGYLLRELPGLLIDHGWLFLAPLDEHNWQAYYREGAAKPNIKARADTPEDALALLAIRLIEEGILNPVQEKQE